MSKPNKFSIIFIIRTKLQNIKIIVWKKIFFLLIKFTSMLLLDSIIIFIFGLIFHKRHLFLIYLNFVFFSKACRTCILKVKRYKVISLKNNQNVVSFFTNQICVYMITCITIVMYKNIFNVIKCKRKFIFYTTFCFFMNLLKYFLIFFQ